MASVMVPSPVKVMTRTSTCSPQTMSQPVGCSGWGSVVWPMVAAARRTASSRSAAVIPAGGAIRVVESRGRCRPGVGGRGSGRPAGLHFGDLAVDELDRAAAAWLRPSGCAWRGHRARHSSPDRAVPDDVVVVVVAVQAQRLCRGSARRRVGADEARADRLAVRAAGFAAGVAGIGCGTCPSLTAHVTADMTGVDWTEGGCGEGDERRRVRGYGGGDALAADEAGAGRVGRCRCGKSRRRRGRRRRDGCRRLCR